MTARRVTKRPKPNSRSVSIPDSHRPSNRTAQTSISKCAGGLLVAALAVAGLAVAPTGAEAVSAYCVDGNTLSYQYSNSWGREGANSGTCDGLGDYWGFYKDLLADGYKVTIEHCGFGYWAAPPMTNAIGNFGWSYQQGRVNQRLARGDGYEAPIFFNKGY